MADYKVGIELLLASNGEAVLGVLGRRLLGIHGQVKDLEGGFGRLKLAIGGAFAIGGAMALLGVMDKLIKKGAELEQQMYRLQTLGMSPQEMAAVKSNATRVAGRFPNLTERELIRLTGETTAVYGDPKVAMANLGIAAAYVSAVKYRHPEDPEGATATAEDAIFKILRSEEMRGLAQNPAEIRRALAATLKGQEVFGDQFDPTVGFQAVKYGRLASRYLWDRFLEGPGLIMAQELGGSNFGNSLNMTLNGLVGGHITKSALAKLEEVGIIDRRKVKTGAHGTFDLGNAVPDQKLLQSDPDLWFQKYFAPKVDAYAHGDVAKRDQVIRQLFQRGTAQQMAELLGWQTGPGGRISKDVNRLKLAMTPEQAVAAAQTNLATSTTNLSTQFDRLAAALGDPMAKGAGHISRALVGPAKAAADAAAKHPGGSAVVDGLLGAGAAALGVAGLGMLYKAAKPILALLGIGGGPGAAAVAGAATKGPAIAGGIRAVGGSLAALGSVRLGAIALGLGRIVGPLLVVKGIVDGIVGVDNPKLAGELRAYNAAHPHPIADFRDSIGRGAGKIYGEVILDGKKVGTWVGHALSNGMGGPSRGPGGFDPSRSYSPAGMPAY